MSETKSCGNCRYFKDEDADGKGYCENFHGIFRCDEVCVDHDVIDNGWKEITPDNMDEVYCIPKDKVVIGWICNKEFRSCSLSCFWFTLKSIVKEGGFYYYVLPELKFE